MRESNACADRRALWNCTIPACRSTLVGIYNILASPPQKGTPSSTTPKLSIQSPTATTSKLSIVLSATLINSNMGFWSATRRTFSHGFAKADSSSMTADNQQTGAERGMSLKRMPSRVRMLSRVSSSFNRAALEDASGRTPAIESGILHPFSSRRFPTLP